MAREFRYPTGARPLLLEETARRRCVESKFVSILEQASFAEVVLPIIDFSEPYAGLEGREEARRSYRFVDREGELVSVRSDFTPLAARALAPSLASACLPLRIFYRGDVIRCEPSRLGTDRELFQIGAEIVGDPTVAADVEVLRLCVQIARAFGVEPLVVFTDASIAARFDAGIRAALLTGRCEGEIPALARKMIDGTATIADVREADARAAARLEATVTALAGDAAYVLQLDDAESSSGYYTGLRFRLFGADPRTPIAQGGRYDDLYGRFGTAAPAVGFTFSVDDLASARTRPLQD